jgi:nucleoside-diphosphate-sugar epimerase
MRFDKVLVTGGAGRLGRYVVAELAGHCRVGVLDRAAGADFPADVLDLDAVARALPGHDAVIHLAAIDVSVPSPPERLFDVNVRGTWNVLQAAQQAGVRRAVVCSSVAATGIDSPAMAPLYLPIDEAHPLRPTHPYGLSKEVDEAIARSFARRGGMEVIVLRPAWVMFPEILQAVLDELAGALPPAGPVTATDPGERAREPLPLLRSWVDPVDTARAFRLALELPRAAGEAFFITAADTFEPTPTLPYLQGVFGALPEIRKPEVYARDPRASAHDCARAREILGWSPSTTWRHVSLSPSGGEGQGEGEIHGPGRPTPRPSP